MASFDEAAIILALTLASSGDLREHIMSLMFEAMQCCSVPKERMIYAPVQEDQLAPLSLSRIVLKVEHRPSTVLLRQLFQEAVEIPVGGSLQNDDGVLLLRKTKDDPSELSTKLDLLVFCDTVGILFPLFVREARNGRPRGVEWRGTRGFGGPQSYRWGNESLRG